MNKPDLKRPHQESQRGVTESDTLSDLDRVSLDWDNLKIFVQVAQTASLRQGADKIGMEVQTVARRLRELEASLGGKLLIRSPQGIRLTELGERTLERGRKMALEVASIAREAGEGPQMTGRVRLSITEGLGIFWLMPRLVEFQRAHPRFVIDAKCSMTVANTLFAETDLSIQFAPPQGADVKAIRLGTLHVLPFASREYEERFGLPQSRAELGRHKIILQPASQLDEDAQLKQWGVTKLDGVISFRTDSSAAVYTLIRLGGGIGALPSYAACLDRALIPLEIDGLHHTLPIWLAFHPDVRNVPRVAAAIEWVRANFDKARFPWFRDEYVSAGELATLPSDPWRINVVPYGWNG